VCSFGRLLVSVLVCLFVCLLVCSFGCLLVSVLVWLFAC